MDQNDVVAQTLLPLITIDVDVRSSAGSLAGIEDAIVDTGAQVCVLGRDVVRKLGIAVRSVGEKLSIQHGFSEELDHGLYLFNLRVWTRDDGAQEIADIPVIVVDGSKAVLGLPFLERFTYRISNDGHGRGMLYLISLKPAASANPKGSDQSLHRLQSRW